MTIDVMSEVTMAGSETAGGGRTDLARKRTTEKMYRPSRLYPLGELGGRLQQQNFGEIPGRWNSVLWRLHFALHRSVEVCYGVMVTVLYCKCAGI
jgi:hypothetical protein